jgi:uncharacterized protein
MLPASGNSARPTSAILVDVETRELAELWGLAPHPEGGYYRETYRSPLTVAPDGWPGPRALVTAILYLLPAGEQSAWHRVRGDELWLWQGGGPMLLNVGDTSHLVGPDRRQGHEFQALVPGGTWQSATPAAEEWSLVACVVAPGFDFSDFEMR